MTGMTESLSGSAVEILAPAGNMDTLIAVLKAGADAVYIGGKNFSARSSAVNFTEEEILRLGNDLDRICRNLDEADQMNLIEQSERGTGAGFTLRSTRLFPTERFPNFASM